jgi:lysophospholipase-3
MKLNASFAFVFVLLSAYTLVLALPVAKNQDIGAAGTDKWLTNRSRIVLIHGISASQLSAKVQGSWWWNFLCRSSSPKVIWIGRVWCLKYLKMEYNTASNTYKDIPDADVSVPGFGGTSTVECVSSSSFLCRFYDKFQYMKKMVDYFADRGYKRGVDIRAAPYDWRLAPDMAQQLGYFSKLRNLIEDMYNGVGVTIVAHSMGGLMSLYFLNEVVTQEWKDKYIKAYIPIGAPYGGAVKVIETWLTGKMGIDLTDEIEEYVSDILRTFESPYWLFPRPDVFDNGSVIVETPTRSYTTDDYQQFFHDANYPVGWNMYQPTLNINKDLKNPNVSTYCLYGTGVKTHEKLIVLVNDNKFSSDSILSVKGEGDGSANRKSLEVCNWWTQNKCTTTGEHGGHVKIMKSTATFKTIESIINDQYTCYL